MHFLSFVKLEEQILASKLVADSSRNCSGITENSSKVDLFITAPVLHTFLSMYSIIPRFQFRRIHTRKPVLPFCH